MNILFETTRDLTARFKISKSTVTTIVIIFINLCKCFGLLKTDSSTISFHWIVVVHSLILFVHNHQ